MTPVSSKAQSILDAAVEGRAVDPSRMSANLSALEARIAAGDLGPDFDPGPPPSPQAAAGGQAAIGTGAKLAAGLAVVGALLFAALPGEPAPSNGARVGAPAVATTSAELLPEAAPDGESEAVEGAAAPIDVSPQDEREDEAVQPVELKDGAVIRTKKTTRIAAPPKAKAEPDSSIDRLEEEMALMSDARRALGRGDARKALELLNRHRRDFPKGEFRRERVVSRVTALCALGQKDAAKRVADGYLAKDSSSVHAQRIQQSCAAGK